MSEEERIALDNRYADYFTGNNYSLWFDLKILLRTVPALFQKSTVQFYIFLVESAAISYE